MTKHQNRPSVAIFDYSVSADNAMGSCHLGMLAGLSDKYDFTVFATKFENPAPLRIAFVRVPAPSRPTILLSLVFHILAPLCYAFYRLKNRMKFDLVQKMEVFTFLGSIAYVHFCHRVYLQRYWRGSKQPGVRGLLLILDQAARAFILEPIIYRYASNLVVPSMGLARELIAAYPFTRSKIHLLPNFADFRKLSSVAASFDRGKLRAEFGFGVEDMVLVFIALGQFERKGLPQLLDAIALVRNPRVKLLVVGGSNHWIDFYRLRAQQLAIEEGTAFVGLQREIAPYLWIADAFAMPTLYETFLLVALQAAAAGLPVLVTRVNGVEDYIEDLVSGLYVERTVESIAQGISQLIRMGPEGRTRMGKAAQSAARDYTAEHFVSRWDEFLTQQLENGGFLHESQQEEAGLAIPR